MDAHLCCGGQNKRQYYNGDVKLFHSFHVGKVSKCRHKLIRTLVFFMITFAKTNGYLAGGKRGIAALNKLKLFCS